MTNTLLHTNAFQQPSAFYRALRVMCIALMPHLKWRHHGIGCLQAYVREACANPIGSATNDEWRLHLWDPSLVLEGMAESGRIHDHRFDLESHVLVGHIQHVELVTRENAEGEFEEYDVTNARASGPTFHTDPVKTGRRFSGGAVGRVFDEGESYAFDRGVFHWTAPLAPSLTLCRKKNQSGQARILGAWGRTIVNAFGNEGPHGNLTRPDEIFPYVDNMISRLEKLT